MNKDKKGLNWKEIGRIFSAFLKLFTLIRDTFVAQSIEPEIIDWVIGGGKETFVEGFLKPLGKAFLAAQRVIVLDKDTIRVNLSAKPILPFEDATVETNKNGGWVTVQKRANNLYVDGRKVILHQFECQKDDKVVDVDQIYGQVMKLPVLHPNIMDALCEHHHLIPDDWKKDNNGNAISIYFWAVTYLSDGIVGVRYLYHYNCNWFTSSNYLGYTLTVNHLAAILE